MHQKVRNRLEETRGGKYGECSNTGSGFKLGLDSKEKELLPAGKDREK